MAVGDTDRDRTLSSNQAFLTPETITPVSDYRIPDIKEILPLVDSASNPSNWAPFPLSGLWGALGRPLVADRHQISPWLKLLNCKAIMILPLLPVVGSGDNDWPVNHGSTIKSLIRQLIFQLTH
jgi:hypothetical protein